MVLLKILAKLSIAFIQAGVLAYPADVAHKTGFFTV